MKFNWRARAELMRVTRDFFSKSKFIEVETPILTLCPGAEVHLNFFNTDYKKHSGQTSRWSLRSSPELHMKRVVSSETPHVFQIAKCFRNHGEFSEWHHPEFTMLEWYMAHTSLDAMMDFTGSYLRESLAHMRKVFPDQTHFEVPTTISRHSIYTLFKDLLKFELIDQDADLASKARSAGVVSVRTDDDFETAFFKILIERLEPWLERRGVVCVYDYPPSQAALSEVVDHRAQRFEFYVGRVELCNAFRELGGSKKNEKRLADISQRRLQMGKDPLVADWSFIEDMDRMPPTSGNALGLDRWLALILGQSNIDQVIPFRSEF